MNFRIYMMFGKYKKVKKKQLNYLFCFQIPKLYLKTFKSKPSNH